MDDNPSAEEDLRPHRTDDVLERRLFFLWFIRIRPSVEVLELSREEDAERIWIIAGCCVRGADDALEALASQGLPRRGARIPHPSQRSRMLQHPVELTGRREAGDLLHALRRHRCDLHDTPPDAIMVSCPPNEKRQPHRGWSKEPLPTGTLAGHERRLHSRRRARRLHAFAGGILI